MKGGLVLTDWLKYQLCLFIFESRTGLYRTSRDALLLLDEIDSKSSPTLLPPFLILISATKYLS